MPALQLYSYTCVISTLNPFRGAVADRTEEDAMREICQLSQLDETLCFDEVFDVSHVATREGEPSGSNVSNNICTHTYIYAYMYIYI